MTFKMRSKLFRFAETLLDKGSGKKQWIERGVGEIKLLKHRENSMIRVLMRQEKTMKIIANHVVDPRIELEPNVGSDRSWVWSCFDFAEGAELVEEIFAIRFGNAENVRSAASFLLCFLFFSSRRPRLPAGGQVQGRVHGGPEGDDGPQGRRRRRAGRRHGRGRRRPRRAQNLGRRDARRRGRKVKGLRPPIGPRPRRPRGRRPPPAGGACTRHRGETRTKLQ